MRRIAVIVPVLNESQRINGLIDHVKSLVPCLEPGQEARIDQIIVVDGDPGQGTLNAISNQDVLTAVSEPGRARQMNAGARLAQGDYLLFLHADTILPESAACDVSACLADMGIGLGAFGLEVAPGGRMLRLFIRLADLRNRLLKTPYGDQALFLRQEVFDQAGGFPDQPIMEDVDLVRRVRKMGFQVRILRSRVCTSDRRWQQEGLLRCTARNLSLRLLHALGVSPHRLARWYANHKEGPEEHYGQG